MHRRYLTADVFTKKRAGRVERVRIGGRCVEVMTESFELAAED